MKKAKNKPSSQTSSVLAAIVDAGAHLFAKLGIDRATTNKIAERAGVSIGSLYQYFPNKDAIFSFVIDRMLTENREVFVLELQRHRGRPLGEAIDAVTEVGVQRFLDRRGLLRVLFSHIQRFQFDAKLLEARKILATEMAVVLRRDFPNEIQSDGLEDRLLLAFNAYMGHIQFVCFAQEHDSSVASPVDQRRLQTELAALMRGYLVKKTD